MSERLESERLKLGILVIGHGSRRMEANDDVRDAAQKIKERGLFDLVEAGFLEIEQPDIADGFAKLVRQGARHIIVHPYFLSPGRHTRGDIPVEVKSAAKNHIAVSYHITEPLAAHPSVIEASVERIRNSINDLKPILPPRFSVVWVEKGVVYLVGAGPGDPGLLTIKANNLLASCDTVIYDNLVNPEILSYAPKNASRIFAGKIGGGPHTPQPEINRLMIRRARSGERVVRLKGGDPFIYGRGGEEALALREAGIKFEIVPGISSALAVPAYAGIPLTHRAFSKSVAILTGARAGDGDYPESIIAQAGNAETIVILMGGRHLRKIAADLIKSGRSKDLPAAIIRSGTYSGQQQTITGTLETIGAEVENERLCAPAIIVIGEVVRLREKLQWFENKAADAADQNLFSGDLYQETNRIFSSSAVV